MLQPQVKPGGQGSPPVGRLSHPCAQEMGAGCWAGVPRRRELCLPIQLSWGSSLLSPGGWWLSRPASQASLLGPALAALLRIPPHLCCISCLSLPVSFPPYGRGPSHGFQRERVHGRETPQVHTRPSLLILCWSLEIVDLGINSALEITFHCFF